MNFLSREMSKIKLYEFCLAIYYLWFFMPFMRTVFDGAFKYLFFAFYVAGLVLLLVDYLKNNDGRVPLKFTILVPILIYIFVFTVMVLLNVMDAGKHIRVSFTFWGTAFIYFLINHDKEAQIRFGKFLIIIILVTFVTSFVGVLIDPSAARALANASQAQEALEQDYILGKKNIASIYFYQCLVIMVPFFVFLIKKGKTFIGIILLIFSIVVVINASFTISVLIMFVAIIFCLLYSKKWKKNLILFFVLIVVFLLPWADILSKLATKIVNPRISSRIKEIALFLSTGNMEGDLSLRSNAYRYSIETFLHNPFGIGPEYSYIVGNNGVGHHSQFLDDLARFGIFGLAFYIAFFVSYYKLLYKQWKKINMEDVVFPTCLIYISLVILNLAFRSADESIFILFILPVLPEIISIKNKKNKLINANRLV